MKYPVKKIVEEIQKDNLVVLPTDTIFGIVASTLSKKAATKLYRAKNRSKRKPFITLISSIKDLDLFGITATLAQKKKLKELWPGPISVVIGNQAFRLPVDPNLRRLLKHTGPLLAPSANPEGLPPAQNLKEAVQYFGRKVALYVDGKPNSAQASTLIQLDPDGQITVIRPGTRPLDGKQVK